jgi:hypothetical protein
MFKNDNYYYFLIKKERKNNKQNELFFENPFAVRTRLVIWTRAGICVRYYDVPVRPASDAQLRRQT